MAQESRDPLRVILFPKRIIEASIGCVVQSMPSLCYEIAAMQGQVGCRKCCRTRDTCARADMWRDLPILQAAKSSVKSVFRDF